MGRDVGEDLGVRKGKNMIKIYMINIYVINTYVIYIYI